MVKNEEQIIFVENFNNGVTLTPWKDYQITTAGDFKADIPFVQCIGYVSNK